MATQPVEILRAAMEAVALRFALIARGLDEAFPEEAGEKEVVATGGGLLGSPAWIRIIADALGKSVRASAVPEASSRAARSARSRDFIGSPSIEEVEAPFGETYEPNPMHHEIHGAALDRQRKPHDT